MQRGTTRPAGLVVAASAVLALTAAAPLAAQHELLPFSREFKYPRDVDFDGPQFGKAVALDGSTAAVWALPGRAGEPARGAVHIYDTTTGARLHLLTPFDIDEGGIFGTSLALSGSTLLIGAPLYGPPGATVGAAYLYDTETGSAIARLEASDGGTEITFFGLSVALDGTTALVGAPEDEGGGTGPSAGAAYAFDTETQTEIRKLTDPVPSEEDLFGYAVGVSGSIAAVGAPLAADPDDEFGEDKGAVYVFDLGTGALLHTLRPSGLLGSQGFGGAIAVSGNLAVIGSYPVGGSRGAYVFDLTTGEQLHTLVPAESNPFSVGYIVALDGPIAVIDSPFDAAVFDATTGEQIAALAIPSERAFIGDLFGANTRIAVSGGDVLLGFPFVDDSAYDAVGSTFLHTARIPVDRQPEGVIVERGEAASFDLALVETEGVAYQWRRDGVDLVDDARISGTQTATLTISTTTDGDSGFYDCVHTSRFGPPSVSDPAVLGVLPSPNPCLADLNADGLFDLEDIIIFVTEFTAGCP